MLRTQNGIHGHRPCYNHLKWTWICQPVWGGMISNKMNLILQNRSKIQTPILVIISKPNIEINSGNCCESNILVNSTSSFQLMSRNQRTGEWMLDSGWLQTFRIERLVSDWARIRLWSSWFGRSSGRFQSPYAEINAWDRRGRGEKFPLGFGNFPLLQKSSPYSLSTGVLFVFIHSNPSELGKVPPTPNPYPRHWLRFTGQTNRELFEITVWIDLYVSGDHLDETAWKTQNVERSRPVH